ncbi:MAG: hypothetical protein CMP33_00320 [Rickettsiales bacterium]|nr:hypothetical protein [Rickettsiales bacterium]
MLYYKHNMKTRVIMKNIMNGIGYILIALGIMAMAGSAGDCDGKCVENANTIGQMLIIAGTGLAMFLFGAMLLLSNRGEA